LVKNYGILLIKIPASQDLRGIRTLKVSCYNLHDSDLKIEKEGIFYEKSEG